MTQTPSPSPSLAWCLFLDVDGTLIELSDSPFDIVASEELKHTLGEVSQRLGGAVALVSGRSIEYLDKLFAPLHLPAAGLHGVERRKSSGVLHGASFADGQLDRARAALEQFVGAHPGTLLEDKGRTVAVHYRLAPQFEAQALAAVNAIVGAMGSNYHVQHGNMMMEIKPRGFSKGSAIKAFLQEPPFSGRVPVFVGDDLTDLDGFHVVDDEGGISIAVGSRVEAQRHLENPAAVRRWLQEIAALTDSHHE